jgi:putative addiction module component, TIGR02574 family
VKNVNKFLNLTPTSYYFKIGGNFMTLKAIKLATEALHLSPNDRAILADSLLVSLDQPDPKIDALWKTEVEKRLRDYKSGKIKAVPLSKVLGNYRKKKAA